MSSRNTCKRVSSSNVEKQWPIPCVYCHDDKGAFLKNGKVEYGRHHVKDCLKTKKRKPSRGRSKPSFKKEVDADGSVWTVKVIKKKNRVSNGAMKVLKSAQNTFGPLMKMDDQIAKEDAKMEKFLKAEKAKTIPSITTSKPVMGGWLAVAKAKKPKVKKPMSKKKNNIKIPIVESKPKTTSPKRVEELKKEKKSGYIPTPFEKGSVMPFSDIQKMFSNTDSWGDSDDDC